MPWGFRMHAQWASEAPIAPSEVQAGQTVGLKLDWAGLGWAGAGGGAGVGAAGLSCAGGVATGVGHGSDEAHEARARAWACRGTRHKAMGMGQGHGRAGAWHGKDVT